MPKPDANHEFIWNLVCQHPQLPFSPIRYPTFTASDGAGSYCAHLFNTPSIRLTNWIGDIAQTINLERRTTRRSIFFARGWDGDLPNPSSIGKVIPDVDSDRASSYLTLTAILVDQTGKRRIGVVTFGFQLNLEKLECRCLELTVHINHVWISRPYRGRGLSSILSQLVANSTSRYLRFLDDGCSILEDWVCPVSVTFEGEGLSTSGSRFIFACSRKFKVSEQGNRAPALQNLQIDAIETYD